MILFIERTQLLEYGLSKKKSVICQLFAVELEMVPVLV